MTPTEQSQRRFLREWWSTAALTLVLLASLTFTEVTRPLGDLIYDHWLRWHGFESTNDIVLVTIDDRSLQQLGHWPLPRNHYTKLLSNLKKTGNQPKAIGFDLLLLSKSSEDVALAKAMREQVVVLPLEFQVSEDLKAPFQIVTPPSALSQASQLGHINLNVDPDGIIRGFDVQANGVPQLCILMHRTGKPNSPYPAPRDGHLRFEMVNPAVDFPKVSLVDALDPHYPTGIFKDKFVLVGVTATDLGDRYPTIYSGKNNLSTPGVEILASILKGSLEGRLIDVADKRVVFLGSLVVLSVVLLSLLKIPPRWGLILDGTLILSLLLASYGLLVSTHLWVSPVPLVLVLLLLKPIWSWRRLEAILYLVKSNTSELKQPENLERRFKFFSSQDVVLRYGQILETAVLSARAQIDFLDLLIRQLPNGVFIFDEFGQVLLKNQSATRLLEFHQPVRTQPELLRQLKVTPPPSFHEDFTSPVLPIICNLMTPQGEKELYLRIEKVTPIGGASFVIAILTDVTELRQSQTQRDRALQFLSHDMRTPIASIMAVTQNLDSQDLVKQKVNQHAKTLLQMMEDFILTVKVETMAEHFESVLFDNVLDDAIEQSADLAHQRKVKLIHTTQPNGIFVNADLRLLVRMLMNLIFNAIKFSPTGAEVTLSQRLNLVQTGSSSGYQVELVISNWVDEAGNPETSNTTSKGFGLGLVFVDTVVKRHQGFIERTIPERGVAEVKVTLPCEVHEDQ